MHIPPDTSRRLVLVQREAFYTAFLGFEDVLNEYKIFSFIQKIKNQKYDTNRYLLIEI